jgi:hypothetical protein
LPVLVDMQSRKHRRHDNHGEPATDDSLHR